MQKIRLLLEAGKTKDAIAEGEKLMAAFPEEERFVMAFAEVLAKHEQLPLAISFLEKFTTSRENAGNAAMLLAGLYRDARQEQKARDILVQVFDNPDVEFGSKIIVLSSYNTEINQNRARRIADPDKESFAMVLYNKLAASHPYDTHVHILGGDLYLSTGRNEEAIEEYKTAIGSGDVNFEVWQNLLYLEVQEELYDQVMNDAEKALELFPNQSIIHYFNGYAALHKRKYAEAIFSLEQAKRLSVSEKKLVPEIDSMLGDAYNATRQYDKSDKAYDEALAANPNNYNVLNNYSFFLALRKVNLEKAERMSAKLVKDNPDNASYLDTHAWVLYMREKYKEARKTMEKVIGTGQANATHLEHYGDILFKLGDVDGAVQQWERARGMNANSETLNKKIANRKIYE
ncbi:MAG: tetratricopeptide repeat protein [Bacteroidia bacterium]|nr:tetratricopeptide repeat protein [Bacteroidia bacterium]